MGWGKVDSCEWRWGGKGRVINTVLMLRLGQIRIMRRQLQGGITKRLGLFWKRFRGKMLSAEDNVRLVHWLDLGRNYTAGSPCINP